MDFNAYLVCDTPLTTNDTDRTVNENCILERGTPPVSIFLLYAFVLPLLAIFGLCSNLINAIVFMRPKMTPSAFTYLAALSWLDFLSCLLIMLTSLARSFFFRSPFWITYDYQWQTPLFGITTGAANLILACVSFDRLLYLSRAITSSGAPRFCRRKVARYMIAIVLCISIIVNIPYFFAFVVNPDGSCQVTNFYYSQFYKIHNWFTFILLAILPAIFLLVGNLAIIIVFRRWTKQSKRCQQLCTHGGGHSKVTQKRYQHQMKLTITILIVITLYMIGELPAHMTSRKSALNLIFGGDINRVNLNTMEQLEVICITLNALQLSINIVVYAVINPSFLPEFFACLRVASDTCFRFCGIEAIVHLWHLCWRSFKDASDAAVIDDSTAVNHDADAQMQQTSLPMAAADNCGCDSWSTDSECQDHGRHRAEHALDKKNVAVFATRSSVCAFENACCEIADEIKEVSDSSLGSFVVLP